MPQIVSSAIVNAPPPDGVIKTLHLCSQAHKNVDKSTKVSLNRSAAIAAMTALSLMLRVLPLLLLVLPLLLLVLPLLLLLVPPLLLLLVPPLLLLVLTPLLLVLTLELVQQHCLLLLVLAPVSYCRSWSWCFEQ